MAVLEAADRCSTPGGGNIFFSSYLLKLKLHCEAKISCSHIRAIGVILKIS